jgi:formyltetrahydrofolate deformylase
MLDRPAHIVLRLVCPDRPGILAAISPALAAGGWDIREAAVYGDPDTKTFFVRMELAGVRGAIEKLPALLDPFRTSLGLSWDTRDTGTPMKVLVAVSKTDHCLNDIIHKTRIGVLPIEIVGVVSNHETLRSVTEWHGHSFHHLPVTPETRDAQEAAFEALIAASGAELVVLARYMQILSNGFSKRLAGRCINIHHSFLPSFKGAKPYHQAHARGVKLIGATAHYVTEDLDGGPIIEQTTVHVSHRDEVADLIRKGRDCERLALARALRLHLRRQVMMYQGRTAVFD